MAFLRGPDDLAEAPAPAEDLVAHLLLAPHPGADDVVPALRFQGLEGLCLDHPPVGDQADPADAEARPEPPGDRHEGRHVARVAGPELARDRSALLVEDHADDHLLQVGPVVLAVASLAEGLATLALEVDRGRVEEDELERGEQIPVPGEEGFLDQVLGAPGSEGLGGSLLGEWLAEPGHGPVGVVELQILDPFDPVRLAPLDARAVRAGSDQAVEHLEEDRPLDGELEGAAGEELADHLGTAGLVPEPVEDHRWTDSPRGARGELPAADLGEHQHRLGEAGARFEEDLQAAFRRGAGRAGRGWPAPAGGSGPSPSGFRRSGGKCSP